MVAVHHGRITDLAAMRRRFSVSLKGATLKQLIAIAEGLGFTSRALRGEPEDLAGVALPAILHWDLSHFVVLARISTRFGRRRFHIHDPAAGECVLGDAELSRHFTGVVLELTPSARFERKREAVRLRLAQLWSRLHGLTRSLTQLLALSAGLQLVALAMPFLMQTAVDTVLPAFDADLLLVLALGFGGLTVIQFAMAWLRGWLIAGLANALGYSLVVNLFRHLMQLPLGWFERRHTGDILARFGSTQPLVALLTQGLVAAVIDGALALMTLALMLLYSPFLAAVAGAALAVYLAVRLAFLARLRALNVDLIAANAAEQTALIEGVRGILTIKTLGQESARQRLWQNRKADAVNAAIRQGRAGAAFDAVQGAVFGLETVAFVALAIGMAMRAELTLGMIFAFQAYKQQFLAAGARLIQAGIDWRMTDVHMARLADIALAAPEAGLAGTNADPPPLTGRLELRGVRYRYGDGEPEVLAGVDLVIEAGETVTIVGPSGGGKTTLLKIMLGLIDPTEGEVRVDGVPLLRYGKAAFRRQIGAIMQDDLLFAGSIAENIALFDPEIDMAAVRAAAAAAAIDAEIMAMPMGYESLVGDMGSSLSGGQRQRVLIARALYRRPRYLFADEITASLDPANHARIGAALAGHPATRMIVTHRAFAEAPGRVLLVAGGRVEDARAVAARAA
ncbi:hypothetical protein IP88_09785 [alpha proteobacterium AAP81b]|nr:hypothetical protein IP88_09785 [alpha proteobacterium AAP81b]